MTNCAFNLRDDRHNKAKQSDPSSHLHYVSPIQASSRCCAQRRNTTTQIWFNCTKFLFLRAECLAKFDKVRGYFYLALEFYFVITKFHAKKLPKLTNRDYKQAPNVK